MGNPELAAMRTAAFFDIDHTLIGADSGILFVRYLIGRGAMRWRDLLGPAYYTVLYRLNWLDINAVYRRYQRWVRGRSHAEMEQVCTEWYAACVRPAIYPQMVTAIDEHRRAGHVVAILSSATAYVAEPLARELGIEHLLVNRLIVEGRPADGRSGAAAVLGGRQDALGAALRRGARHRSAAELLLHRRDLRPADARAGRTAARRQPRPLAAPPRAAAWLADPAGARADGPRPPSSRGPRDPPRRSLGPVIAYLLTLLGLVLGGIWLWSAVRAHRAAHCVPEAHAAPAPTAGTPQPGETFSATERRQLETILRQKSAGRAR